MALTKSMDSPYGLATYHTIEEVIARPRTGFVRLTVHSWLSEEQSSKDGIGAQPVLVRTIDVTDPGFIFASPIVGDLYAWLAANVAEFMDAPAAPPGAGNISGS